MKCFLPTLVKASLWSAEGVISKQVTGSGSWQASGVPGGFCIQDHEGGQWQSRSTVESEKQGVVSL